MVDVGTRESTLEQSDTDRSARVGLDWVLTALFGLVAWVVGIARLSDNSFLWHLRTGYWILDHGIPRADPFSYTARGTDWVAQSWLVELVYGAVGRSVGAFGIRLLVGGVTVGIVVGAYRLAFRLARSALVAAGLTVVSFLGPFVAWSERPLTFGLGLFVVLLWTVEAPDSWLGRHAVVVVPVVLVVWTNVHGTFVIGFAYLGLHLLGRLLERRTDDHLRGLLVGGIVGAVLSFVNPYGWRLVLFPVHLLGRGEVLRRVVEWKSPEPTTVLGVAFALWLVTALNVAWRGRARLGTRDVLVMVPMVLLACWAQRNITLVPVVGLPILARAAAARRPGRFERVDRAAARLAIAFVLVLVVGIGAAAAGQPDFALDKYPTAAMRWLDREDQLGRRLLTSDVAGGYVIAAYYPEQRVFLDDRYDMYPVSVIDDYLVLHDGGKRWSAVLDAHRVEVVVWLRSRPLAQLLDASSDWEHVHDAGRWSVWIASDSTP